MATETLLREVEELRSAGYKVDINESDGVVNLIIGDYPLPSTYNKRQTVLLLRVPISYPNGNPDMFWTDHDLMCSNGKIPTKADQNRNISGKTSGEGFLGIHKAGTPVQVIFACIWNL